MLKLKNFKMGKKMAFIFTTFMVVFLAVSMVSIYNLKKAANDMVDFNQNEQAALSLSWTARQDITDLELAIYQMISTTDVQKVQTYSAQADEATASFMNSLQQMDGKLKNSTIIKPLIQNAKQSETVKQRIISAATSGDKDVALRIMEKEYIPLITALSNDIIKISEQVEADAADYMERAPKKADSNNRKVIYTMVLILIFTIVGGKALTNNITKPLAEIENAAREMARGNLNAPITYEAKDEIGTMAENMRQSMAIMRKYIGEISRSTTQMAQGNFNLDQPEEFIGDFKAIQESMAKMVLQISNTLSQINMSAEQVSSGSEQVANGAQALAAGAAEQASSVEQLSSSVSRITKQLNENASNSITANEMASNSKEAIAISNQKMQQLMKAMNDINNKSNEISKIIKTIEDIAFQTNILALNAAVEAARAGQAGKGFAVVADEVRNLATKSSEAAKNTTALIESSVLSINQGVKLADETAKELIGVVESAEATADLIEEITTATNDGAQALTRVATGIDQISAVVQTNSATSEESAAASEELSGQSKLMKEIISRFRLMDTSFIENNNQEKDINIPMPKHHFENK